MSLLKPTLAAALLIAGLAHAEEPAPNAGKRAFDLAVQRDGQRNQSAAAAVSLPVGDTAWLQAGVGRSRSRDAGSGTTTRLGQVALGGGLAGRRWQARVNASHRGDGSALRQNDVAAALDWKPVDAVSLGLDATHRSARVSGTVASSTGGAATPVAQRVKGSGLGAHAAVAVSPRFTVYGSTLRNHYRTSTTQASGGAGLLAGVPLLGRGVSAVNRDEAALDRSHQLGATWRVGDRVALNGELEQDRLHDGGNLRSVQLKAAIAAGAGWTLTPGIGRSRGPQGQGGSYGLLGASYVW